MTEPTLPANATLRDVVRVIEKTRRLIAAVVDADGGLLGVLSDGDIRRALLAGAELDSLAASVMTRTPIVAPASATPEEWLELMIGRRVAAVPVVDADGHFVRVVQMHDFPSDLSDWVGGEGYSAAVIMAGGEGRRLLPLTRDRPKPMVDVGGMPLLERQVRGLVHSGLKQIYLATNYLGHIIEEHFGDGAEFGARIAYLREPEKLGTAGALSLLPGRPDGPLLVMNGDVVTTAEFGKMLRYHRETDAFVTVGATVYRVDIPFGVLRTQAGRATAVEEKPSEKFLCNAGIYVLGPEVLDLIPAGTRIDMTDVLSGAIGMNKQVSVFPIHEYWADIGSPSDLQQVLAEFSGAAQ